MSTTTLQVLPVVLAIIALLCAAGLVGTGIYAARKGFDYCAVFGIGFGIVVASMAAPLLYKSTLLDILNEAVMLLSAVLVVDLAYLATSLFTELASGARFRFSLGWARFVRNFLRSYGFWPAPSHIRQRVV